MLEEAISKNKWYSPPLTIAGCFIRGSCRTMLWPFFLPSAAVLEEEGHFYQFEKEYDGVAGVLAGYVGFGYGLGTAALSLYHFHPTATTILLFTTTLSGIAELVRSSPPKKPCSCRDSNPDHRLGRPEY